MHDTSEQAPSFLANHKKAELSDLLIISDPSNYSFEQKVLSRVYAVEKTFDNISFKQSAIINCYLRKCTFIKCNFTGANIKESYLRGAKFINCQFSYSTWEKTQVDDDILESCLPSEENLARDLVRSLRVNFAQIGNHDAINKAASIEVKLTGAHLFNAAYSKQSYYRDKYKSLYRAKHIFLHAKWKFLDLLWGNGESYIKIIISSLAVIFLGAIFLANDNSHANLATSIYASALQFWGVTPLPPEQQSVALFLIISRLILFSLFMAIIIKKLSKR